MTSPTSLTMDGFIRGLQAELMVLVAIILGIIVVRGIILSVMRKTQSVGVTSSVPRFVNWGTGIAFVLVLIGFGWNAATYGTNAIPHSDLDKSSIYQQMDSNIKR